MKIGNPDMIEKLLTGRRVPFETLRSWSEEDVHLFIKHHNNIKLINVALTMFWTLFRLECYHSLLGDEGIKV